MEAEHGGRVTNHWQVTAWDETRQQLLASPLGIRPIVAQLLINRGIETLEAAHLFLNPTLSDLPSPFLLTDMDRAVDRLLRALSAREPIFIYGDYDLDGISATAILVSFLRSYRADVRLFIPQRERDGYGLQREPIERLIAQGARLIITCDNGTSALEEIEFARARGVDVIVTDHHTMPEVLPRAAAVLNPMRKETPEAFRVLSGAGVAFMLVMAVRKTLRDRDGGDHPNLRRYLDLVTLGTIADVVPLTGVNRILVKYGLDEIEKRQRPGVRALLEVSGVKAGEAMSASTVGFRLAPRLNAAGRLDDATHSVRLLITDDPAEAHQLSELLERHNRKRQELEEQMLREIEVQVAQIRLTRRPSAYVLASPSWHPGVVGIVAARLVEMTHRPGLVLAFRGDTGRGSGRSITGFDLVEALKGCDDLLMRYGGHKMAAGLTLKADQLEAFTARFEQVSQLQLEGLDPRRTLSIDARLPFQAVDEALVTDIEKLMPFGAGNPEPVFSTDGIELLERRTVGRGHLRVRLSGEGRVISGIGFRLAAQATHIPLRGRVSLAYCPQFNQWRGERSVQLRLWDLRAETPV